MFMEKKIERVCQSNQGHWIWALHRGAGRWTVEGILRNTSKRENRWIIYVGLNE